MQQAKNPVVNFHMIDVNNLFELLDEKYPIYMDVHSELEDGPLSYNYGAIETTRLIRFRVYMIKNMYLNIDVYETLLEMLHSVQLYMNYMRENSTYTSDWESLHSICANAYRTNVDKVLASVLPESQKEAEKYIAELNHTEFVSTLALAANNLEMARISVYPDMGLYYSYNISELTNILYDGSGRVYNLSGLTSYTFSKKSGTLDRMYPAIIDYFEYIMYSFYSGAYLMCSIYDKPDVKAEIGSTDNIKAIIDLPYILEYKGKETTYKQIKSVDEILKLLNDNSKYLNSL